MPKFVLSSHAQAVVAERSIRIDWLDRVLSAPERVEDDATDPALKHAMARIPELETACCGWSIMIPLHPYGS